MTGDRKQKDVCNSRNESTQNIGTGVGQPVPVVMRSHLVDCGQRKDKTQWMCIALVDGRKGIHSSKSCSKSRAGLWYRQMLGLTTSKGPTKDGCIIFLNTC